jgi:hypothetical protein
MLVIGSTALEIRLQQVGVNLGRKPHDLDLICRPSEMMELCRFYGKKPRYVSPGHFRITGINPFGQIEFDLAYKGNSSQLYLDLPHTLHADNRQLYISGFGCAAIALPEVLFSIKKSHRYRAHRWEKHIRDYHTLRGMVGSDKLPEITAQRQEELKAHKTPSLQKTKEEFFNDDVSNHVFEHDEIHRVMAHRELPMFEYIKVSPEKVTTSFAKFFAPYVDRLKCVLEEAYVIALERAIIPMLYEGKKLADPASAMQWALMRICTTLTGGWFREFASDNYPTLWKLWDRNYVNKFLTAVEEGRIKRLRNTYHEA